MVYVLAKNPWQYHGIFVTCLLVAIVFNYECRLCVFCAPLVLSTSQAAARELIIVAFCGP